MHGIIILDGHSPGEIFRLQRLSKGLRQIDVATKATDLLVSWGPEWSFFRIQPGDVSALEHGGRVSKPKRRAILAVLGLEEPAP